MLKQKYFCHFRTHGDIIRERHRNYSSFSEELSFSINFKNPFFRICPKIFPTFDKNILAWLSKLIFTCPEEFLIKSFEF